MNRNRSIVMGALLTCALVVLGTLGLGTSRAASHSLGTIATPAFPLNPRDAFPVLYRPSLRALYVFSK